MTGVTPQLGVKMSSNDARAYIDEVNKKVIQRWNERVTQGPVHEEITRRHLADVGD